MSDPRTYTSLFNKLRAIVLECIGQSSRALHLSEETAEATLLAGFTDRQKDVMRSMVREKLIDEVSFASRHYNSDLTLTAVASTLSIQVYSESEFRLDMGPSLPPSPPTQRHSRRVSQSSLGPDTLLSSNAFLSRKLFAFFCPLSLTRSKIPEASL